MRTDDVGIFWQDFPAKTKRGERVLGPMPPIPETGWSTPKEFPNLSAAGVLGVDVETYDPHLKDTGPGWARRDPANAKPPAGVPGYLHGDGCLVGVSVAVPERSWYFPMRHTVQPETNMDPDAVLAWLSDTLGGDTPKVGANLIYDLGWLREEGVNVGGPCFDVQWAEALLHEQRTIALDDLGERYLERGKETNALYRWCADWYGGGEKDQRANLWRSPPTLVGPYAEADAEMPIAILERQWPLLRSEGLLDLFLMECSQLPMLLDMRFRGVPVDLDAAQAADDKLSEKIEVGEGLLSGIAGRRVNVNAGEDLGHLFDALGLEYPLTPLSKKPSFTKPFLKSVQHPVGNAIAEVRRCMKLRDTFVRSYIMGSHVNGRIHCEFHPLRGTGYGTRSGRYSSSNPNLQNIPSRDPEMAPIMRGIFIPEHGCRWRQRDYSQIEYRFLVHFAVGQGAEQVRQEFRDKPDTDYHAKTQTIVTHKTGRKLARKSIKNINFGLIYGMGLPALAALFGMPVKEVQSLFQDYHAALPFVRSTMDEVSKFAELQGYVTTILGRRSRFDLWEPKEYDPSAPALALDKAVSRYGPNIKRAGTHKALNRKLQGSAADLIKKATIDCYRQGLFAEGRLPLLTVHDELDFSDDGTNPEAWAEIKHVMENALQLEIPVLVDDEVGPDWGHLKKVEQKC
jgi:DNA polymerase I-like protein with 3'-5' exonuclease and polymerase domains